MNNVKKILINMYHIKELGFDCMGYELMSGDIYTYHHIDEAKNGGYYTLDNGAILCGNTHNYLNVVERYDRIKFLLINQLLREMNENKKIDFKRIEYINDILLEFESQFNDLEDKYGNLVIKPNYKVRFLTKK